VNTGEIGKVVDIRVGAHNHRCVLTYPILHTIFFLYQFVYLHGLHCTWNDPALWSFWPAIFLKIGQKYKETIVIFEWQVKKCQG
jgi:hypothetical protein